MYVNKRNVPNLHVFTYDGVPLDNVDSYKYVGAWLDSKGSCGTQAKEVIGKATKSMYMCMSKCKRICSRCPSSLRALLFKSYVIPYLTYACEVTPYKRKQKNDMNCVICKYARWSTGLPQHACWNAVLREAGLRPIQYDFLQARMGYYLLLMSRQESHKTRLALADMQGRVSTSAYSKWYRGIIHSFDKLSCTHLLGAPASKSINKKVVHHLWLKEGGACVDFVGRSLDKVGCTAAMLRTIGNC